jgi:hypothetical protein
MPSSKKILELDGLSDHELAALIDQGSENAAIYVCRRLIGFLYKGDPIPYEFRFRLSLGLNKFISERQCAELLNPKTGIAWALSTRKKFKPAGKRQPDFKLPKKPKGRKHSDMDQNIRLFWAVEDARLILGSLSDSRSGIGAFSEVGDRCDLTPSAVRARYYSTKKILDVVLSADERHQESVELSKQI